MSRIRADKFVNNAATGAPQLTLGAEIPVGYGLTGAGGINVTGVITATSFSGDGSGLTGVASTDNIITGTAATFTNVVKVGTAITIDATSGIVTATSFSGSTGSFTGDVDIADKIIHTGDTNTSIRFPAADTFAVETNGSERARVDSSGRLLIGHTSSTALGVINSKLQVENTDYDGSLTIKRNTNGDGGPAIHLVKSRGTSNGSNTLVADDDNLGAIRFYGTTGSEAEEGAMIRAVVDGTPSATNTDMPTRFEFLTTEENSSAGPVVRMTISDVGDVTMTSNNGGGEVLTINRQAADGTLVSFQQAGSVEGNIAVSGSTVSYNGAHLTRWSQFVGISTNVKSDRPTILRGSVLSNLDEMCEWGEEDNEQLNRMKVSDVEGDPKVAGVFQGYDDADEVYTNDFYCAMTGDFVIRIAQGTTVANGDLLMSAGDGTAKPQGDDIVRSKTVAKVTSTTKSVTYSDGSYCVPCVLMAC